MAENKDEPKPGNDGPPIIEVRDFSAAYSGRVVLEKVNFTVARGEVFVILGGSGCGKSTLLKHLIGLYPPAGGEILIDGASIVTAEGAERLAILRKIGVMYQSGALFGSMTLRENVRLPLEEYTDLPDAAMDLITQMKLTLVGLGDAGGRMPSELSGGMQKRGAIARAMSLDPQVLFLDEPSAGLDPITSAALDSLIVQLSRTLGITFVVVTHELPSIFAIADRVLFLDAETKTAIAEGDPAELRDHSTDAKVRSFLNRGATEGEPEQPT